MVLNNLVLYIELSLYDTKLKKNTYILQIKN